MRVAFTTCNFGSIFGAVWGLWGVAEFRLRLQADFNCDLTRPAPQAGVRRMNIYAKMDPKSEPKIDVWAIRGPTFEVLGRFLRGLILDEFSIGKKSAKNPTFGVRGADFGRVAGRNGSGRRIGRGPSEVRSLQKSE